MSNYASLIKQQKVFFQTGQSKDLSFRKQALTQLANAIRSHESEIVEALRLDLNKSEFEAYSSEVGIVLKEIRDTVKHLHTWAKVKRVRTPFTHLGSRSSIYYEPYGVVLIISPWN